ncbi:hypothetical protein [Effusibacillus dendaii]|uniref:hypothetical protein n=1 Tax=Effusibacillus dendaii TaxID=2743772 RepID=UPI00190C3BE9|nr:hypothetical protein [Effusibacillus dendaii]
MDLRRTLLFIFSLILAVTGTILYVSAKRSGQSLPYYAMGLLAYGWTFVGFWMIDTAARTYKKKYRDRH